MKRQFLEESQSPAEPTDLTRVREVFDLLSESQKERLATTENVVRGFGELFAYLLAEYRISRSKN